jgi:signal transduction histidine kinase
MSFQIFAELYGELTTDYEINLVGPVGVLLFLAIIAYMIVQYQTFNIKVFGAQALVISLWVLIGSLLFAVQTQTAQIIVVATLLLAVIFGFTLIRSVRSEIEARRLLAEANAGQERFIHFLSHEVKGFLTVARNGFAAISEGDYGAVPEQLTAMAKNALGRVNNGVTTVESILKSANLKSGNVTFKHAPFDFCAAIRKRIDAAQTLLEERGLKLDVKLPDGDYIVVGDQEHITNHVLKNLIENAIYYTPKGTIHIDLTRIGDMMRFSIKDTGVGITEADKKKLFTEGGHGAESTKVNAHSTGHGLFIAKNIIVSHGGRIWAESEGQDKGTTFYFELPINPPKSKN